MEKQTGIKFGIGKKLLIYFLVLSLVPLLIGGIISFTITKNQLKENTKAHLSDLARDCGRKISYYVSSHYQSTKLLSQADVFKGDNTYAKQKYIEDAIEAYPFYDAITVIDLNGTITACTRKELIGDSRADRTWFQETVQCKQGCIISLDAYRAETTGWKMVIGFNTTIRDESNREVIGVLTARTSMDHIIERVQILEERTGADNHAYLLNKRGEILVGPDENEFLTAHRLIEFPVVKDLLAGKTGITEYKDDRGEYVISARYALMGDGDFDGWGWGIIVTVPVSEAFKAAFIIRTTMIVLVLVIAFLVTMFAVFISKRFSRPITEVSESALRISKGDLKPIKIKYGLKDEIGDLVVSFNKMTEDLHATTVSCDLLAKEITERKRAEARIEHLNAVLRTIRNVNQLIARVKQRDRLLQGACNSLIETSGYHKAWIALLDESGGLVTFAEAGLGEKFLPMVEKLKSGELTACCRRALGQSNVVVTEDPPSTCADCPLSPYYGVREAITVRLEYGGKVYGLLSASIPRVLAVVEEEQVSLKDVAGDIAFGLHSIELEEKQKQAEEKLQKAHDELELRVKERTTALTAANEKLQKEITERKRVEATLRESEEKFRILSEQSQLGIIIVQDGMIKYSNEAFSGISEYSIEEIFNWKPNIFEKLFHPDDREFVMERVQEKQVSDRDVLTRYQYKIVTKGGAIKWVEMYSNTILYNGREAVMATLINITEKKMAEEKAKMQQQQLIQSERLASLGVLVAGVAHEINNPNHTIMSNTNLISDTWKSIIPILEEYYKESGDFVMGGSNYTKMREKIPIYFKGISDGAKRIDSIISDLKNYARQEDYKIKADINMNIVVKSAITLVSNFITKATKNFNVEFAEDILQIKGNLQRLEQVLINLIQNACQALPNREKAIFVKTSYNKSKQRLEVNVRDEGVGISPEDLPRVKDPFFTTKRDLGGTGLGLSISSAIIEDHKGTLNIRSEPGKGTTATIILPVIEDNTITEELE